MRIGDYDVKIIASRVGGGWQAEAILPDGKRVVSGPCSSAEDAEHDVEQQAKARLYPQRRYDVNRPFESMNIEEKKAKLGTGARFAKLERTLSHKKGIRDPAAVAAAHGRKTLGKKRFQQLAAAGRRRHSESVERRYPDISAADEAVVMHQADQLLEAVASDYEIHPETGEQVERPECPNCGGPGEAIAMGRYRCANCGSSFAADLGRYDARSIAQVPAKAAFYPSDGGTAGGGGGMTTA